MNFRVYPNEGLSLWILMNAETFTYFTAAQSSCYIGPKPIYFGYNLHGTSL